MRVLGCGVGEAWVVVWEARHMLWGYGMTEMCRERLGICCGNVAGCGGRLRICVAGRGM